MAGLGFFLSIVFLFLALISHDPGFIVMSIIFMTLEILRALTDKANEVKKCPPHVWQVTDSGKLVCKLCGQRPSQ